MAKNSKFWLKVVLLFCIVLGLAVSAKVRAGVVLPPSPYEPPTTFIDTTFIDEDGDGIDDNLEQHLANKFAPVVIIESDESNYPVNVDWFLARARLQYHEDCGINLDCLSSQITDVNNDIAGPGLTQYTLLGPNTSHVWADGEYCSWCDTGYSHPPHHPLTTIATDPDGQWSVGSSTTGYSDQQTFVIPDLADEWKIGSTNPRDWKTYFHAYPASDGGIMLQYWHIFAYNGLAVFLGGCGNHGGDWDATIHVHLGPDLQVKDVTYSRHDDDSPGHTYGVNDLDWSGAKAVRFVPGTTHPLMTIDGGGHAAYASDIDFCSFWLSSGVSHAAGFYTGNVTANWPSDMGDPMNLGKLQSSYCCPTNQPGGIFWETWDNGNVTSGPNNWYGIPPLSGHGGMVNLGEYNPCGLPEGFNSRCYGSKQASTLLAGEFHPLNGQIFIAYEGRWGNLGTCATPPRGPVFQGFVDNKEGKVSEYTAWYNEAANEPASPATHPWRQSPVTWLTLTGLTSFDGTHNYISGATTASFIVDQNPVAASYGNPRTYYRIYPVGGVAPTFNRVSGAFALPAEPDGYYLLEYYSMDALNNQEMDNQGFPKVSSLVFTKLNKLNSTGVYFMAGGYRATASMDVSMTPPNLMPSGWLKFNYRTSTMTCYLSSTQLTEAWMLSDKKTMMIGGFATVNNQPGYYFWAGATDNGSPGAGLDQFSITVLDPHRNTFLYIPSTTISGGDLVIKPRTELAR